MLCLSVNTVVSLDIMHAQHVTIYLINMVFLDGTHSEVGTVLQHPALHWHDQRGAIIGVRFLGCAKSQQQRSCVWVWVRGPCYETTIPSVNICSVFISQQLRRAQMAQCLNESVAQAAEEARQEELRRKI